MSTAIAFDVGEHVQHSSLGKGVIEKFCANGCVVVKFDDSGDDTVLRDDLQKLNSATKTFLEIALPFAERGIPVCRVQPNSKLPMDKGWPDLATTDRATLTAWSTETPNAGVALVAKADGFCFFESDLSGVMKRFRDEIGEKFQTLTQQSRPGRYHYVFRQTELSRKIGSITQKELKVGSFRQNNAYIVGAGSIHPETKEPYRIVCDAPIIPIPDSFLTWLVAQAQSHKTETSKESSSAPVQIKQGGRNDHLISEAGKLRRLGLEFAELEPIIQRKNLEDCAPPLDSKEVGVIARSACTYEKGPTGPTVLIGGKDPQSGVQVTTAPSASTTSFQAAPVDWRTQFKTVEELEDGGVQMIVDGFLPAGTDLFGSLAGHGKTFVCLSITKALTTGQPFVGNFNVPKRIPVLYLIPESSGRAFKNRLKKFGIPNDPEWFLCRTISEGPTLRLNDPAIIEAVTKMRPVVILDTLIRFSEASDENAAAQNKGLCDDIIRLRQCGAISVIAIHHSPKMSAEAEPTLENTLRGTGDFGALADAVYSLRQEEFDGEISLKVKCVKPRDFDEPLPFRLVMKTRVNGELVSKIDTTGDFEFVEPGVDVYNKRAALAKAVAENPTTSAENLAERLKISRNRIPDMLRELGWEKRNKRSHWTRIVGDPSSPSSFDDEDEDQQESKRVA
jgi:hypothetical protein